MFTGAAEASLPFGSIRDIVLRDLCQPASILCMANRCLFK